MGIPRRQFLKGLWQSWQVSALGLMGVMLPQSFGLGSQNAAAAADPYGWRLTQDSSPPVGRSSGRKLAVLVGINSYENFPLKGCLTDVALQRELMIHRFGFAPGDIVTLTNEAATAKNIAQAVTEHLIAQALPEDLVVWHFSGYGTRLNGKDALLPVDETTLISLDLVQHWLQSMAAHQVLGIIDAGFDGATYGTSGNLGSSIGSNNFIGNTALRARPSQNTMKLMADVVTGVIADQPSTPKNSPPKLIPQPSKDRKSSQAVEADSLREPQVCLLMAATADQLCLDINVAGFSCGAFTYALTQSLWTTTTPLTDKELVTDLARRLVDTTDTLPVVQWLGNHNSVNSANAARLLPLVPQGELGSGGVILGDTKNRDIFDLWLMGLPPHVLGNYDNGSILRIATGQLKEVSNISADTLTLPPGHGLNDYWLGLQSRQGLLAKAELLYPEPMPSKNLVPSLTKITAGDMAQEQMRVLPKQIALYVALDHSLNKIERVDATSALSAQPNLGPLLQPLNTSADQPPDCIFSLQEVSYGILTLNRQPLVGSFGSVGESVGVAIKRLTPSFAELLAAKLLRLTENAAGSQIAVQASLYHTGTALKSEATKSSPQSNFEKYGERRLVSTACTDWFNQSRLSRSGLPHSQARSEPMPTGITSPAAPDSQVIPQKISQSIAQVNLGDHIECRIDNGEDIPLYVELFYIDSRGRLMNRTAANQSVNPTPNQSYQIAPHQTLALPQAPFSWSVTAPKGRVEVLVMVSRHPFDHGRAVLTNDTTSNIYPLNLAEGILLDLHQQSLDHQEHIPPAIRKTLHSYLPNDDHHWILDVHQWATLTLTYHVS